MLTSRAWMASRNRSRLSRTASDIDKHDIYWEDAGGAEGVYMSTMYLRGRVRDNEPQVREDETQVIDMRVIRRVRQDEETDVRKVKNTFSTSL